MTETPAPSPTVHSKNTTTKHGFVFDAKRFQPPSVVSPTFASTARPPTVQSEATNQKHDYDFINEVMKEGFQQLSVQINKQIDEQMNELFQKIIDFTNFTQQFQVHQTDSAADADSFDDESPPRGDTSDRNCSAFWHFFLPPEHHEHTPSVKLTRYYDCFKCILLFLILLQIDDRYGDG